MVLAILIALMMSATTVQAKTCQRIFAVPTSLKKANVQIPLHYNLEKSKNSKGNILLVHGLGDDLTQLNQLSNHLMKAGYSVLRVDLHGHGQNLKTEVPSSINYQLNVRDIIKVLEYLDFKNPIVVGHSYGGAIAYAVTNQLKSNQRLKPASLIMMGPYLRRLDYSFLTGNPILDAQVEYMSEGYMRQTFREHFIARDLNYIDARVDVAIATTKGIRNFDILSESKIASPKFKLKMLLIAGDKDQLVTPQYLKSFHNKLNNEGYSHRFVFVEGDHFFPQNNVKQTSKLILNFLEKE